MTAAGQPGGAPDGGREPAAPEPGPAPGWLQTTASVLAAFFGVQSRANRERDFTRGSAGRFIVMGLLMTLVFVGVLVGVVRLVLRLAATG